MRLLFLSMMVILSFSSSSFAYLCDINDAACMQRERALELMEQQNTRSTGGMIDSWGIIQNDSYSGRSAVDTVNKAYGLGSTNHNSQAQYNNKVQQARQLEQQVRQLEAEVARLQEENSDKLCFDTWNMFIADKNFMDADYATKEKMVNNYLNITFPQFAQKNEPYKSNIKFYKLCDKKLRAMFKERLPQLK